MMQEILNQDLLSAIIAELGDKYAIPEMPLNMIIIQSITKIYESDLPVVLMDDGAYLVFRQKDQSLKYVKIKYSRQKTKKILDLIRQEANRYYLKMQFETVSNFLKLKKPYLHARFSYSDDKFDYYDLFYNLSHDRLANNVKGCVDCSEIKKDRIFIDYTTAKYEKNNIIFRERKNIATRQNCIVAIKDICSEIHKKIGKKVWISVKNIDDSKKQMHLSIPIKTNRAVVEYVEKRIREIFRLETVFHRAKEEI